MFAFQTSRLSRLCTLMYIYYVHTYIRPVELFFYCFKYFNYFSSLKRVRIHAFWNVIYTNRRMLQIIIFINTASTDLHISTCIIHLFRYVRPSVPHTGSCSLPQRCSQFDPYARRHCVELSAVTMPAVHTQ